MAVTKTIKVKRAKKKPPENERQASKSAKRLGRSCSQTTASGKAKSGSVAIRVFAMDTSKYLIAASDNQNPPKVTTTTARANLPRNPPFWSGCSQEPILC